MSDTNKLRAALEPFAEIGRNLTDLQCHVGLCEPKDCCRCSKVLAAREALSVPEEAPGPLGHAYEESWHGCARVIENGPRMQDLRLCGKKLADHRAPVREPAGDCPGFSWGHRCQRCVSEPARMSRDEMVEKGADAILKLLYPDVETREAREYTDQNVYDGLKLYASAVLTALGFPGEEKEG